ncbi:MAG: cupredoxin domain-containing protein [Nitrosotalea sp.]
MRKKIGITTFTLYLVVFLVYNTTGSIAYADVQTPTNETTVFITDCGTAGTCFSPCQITIVKGDAITWINSGSSTHMITSGSDQSGPDGWFASSFIAPHGVFSHKFDRVGPFTYFDNLHPSSAGVVIVEKTKDSAQDHLQQSYFSDWCNR